MDEPEVIEPDWCKEFKLAKVERVQCVFSFAVKQSYVQKPVEDELLLQ